MLAEVGGCGGRGAHEGAGACGAGLGGCVGAACGEVRVERHAPCGRRCRLQHAVDQPVPVPSLQLHHTWGRARRSMINHRRGGAGRGKAAWERELLAKQGHLHATAAP